MNASVGWKDGVMPVGQGTWEPSDDMDSGDKYQASKLLAASRAVHQQFNDNTQQRFWIVM